MTTGEWLEQWLAQKRAASSVSTVGRRLAATTARSYRGHLDHYLLPVIGKIPLRELNGEDVRLVFERIDARNRTARKPLSPASIRRLYATLRSALNAAVKNELIASNPARYVTLHPAPRPKPLIWTTERVEEWRRTGRRPAPVMVWTPEQTVAFLRHAAEDPLYALYHVIALRGLRRGEAVGLRWANIDLDRGTLIISEQVVQVGWAVEVCAPKSNSERVVALDQWTVEVLRLHREKQDQQLSVLGVASDQVGWAFTRPDGESLHPAYVTKHFRELTEGAGLPPVRLHDLRHGAATLALASGADLKVVQEMLGHSTIVLTADIYTSVLPQVAQAAAEAVANLLRQAGSPGPPSQAARNELGTSREPPHDGSVVTAP
jgi:integrase